MNYTAKTIPIVDPMMVRVIRFLHGNWWTDGGKLVVTRCAVEDVGLAKDRIYYDEDVVDVSNGILKISTDLMLQKCMSDEIMVFPSRRFRNHRNGDICTLPTDERPLLFIGNPIRLWRTERGCEIIREPSYLIKSGAQIMAEAGH